MDGITGDERMIDTDKYEGHTPAPWKWFAERPLEVALIGDLNSCADTEGGSWFILDQSSWGENPNQDAQLIADAPLLLQEVKRLREENALLASQIRLAYEWVEAFHNEGTMISFIEHVYGDEEE